MMTPDYLKEVQATLKCLESEGLTADEIADSYSARYLKLHSEKEALQAQNRKLAESTQSLLSNECNCVSGCVCSYSGIQAKAKQVLESYRNKEK